MAPRLFASLRSKLRNLGRRNPAKNTESQPSSVGPYGSDRPIASKADDQFGRAAFAERIANTLISRGDASSIVVGLYGKWGEGKTSVLNLMASTLAATPQLAIVRFNPWYFSSQEQLIRSFFDALAESLGRSLPSLKEKAWGLLRDYGALVSIPSSVLGGPGFDALGETATRLSTARLDDLRGRVEEMLSRAGARVVVLMDDIDRLDRVETQAVFKLVKLCADFSHTAYVLAFDDEAVAAALGVGYAAGGTEAGRRFIEKIVQVPLRLPAPDRLSLRSFLFNHIQGALDRSRITLSAPEVQDFGRQFIDGLEPAIGTPRDAVRYANAVDFGLPLLKGEVHAGDQMLLEGMRVFYPTLYERVRGHRDVFVAGRVAGFGDRQRTREAAATILKAALETVVAECRTPAESLVTALFPATRNLGTAFDVERENDPRLEREKRVAAGEYFDRYFQYAIPPTDVPDTSIERLIDAAAAGELGVAGDIIDAAHALRATSRLVDKLRQKEKGADPVVARNLSLAVAAKGQCYPSNDGPLGMTSTRSQAGILVRNLLERYHPEADRPAVARAVLQAGTYLPFAAECLRWLRTGRAEGEAGYLGPEAEQALSDDLAARIAQAAHAQPPYLEYPESAPTLLAVWHQQRPGEVPAYLAERLQANPDEAATLLMTFLPRAWNLETGLPSEADFERGNYNAVVRFVDADVILEALRLRYGDAVLERDFYAAAESPEHRVAAQFAFLHRPAERV